VEFTLEGSQLDLAVLGEEVALLVLPGLPLVRVGYVVVESDDFFAARAVGGAPMTPRLKLESLLTV
jgi:hypothetical protein